MLDAIMRILQFSFYTYTSQTASNTFDKSLDKTADEIWLDELKCQMDSLNRRVDEAQHRVKCGE
jgi:hypothetical protein